MKKNIYKKALVIGAVLFLLLVPIGFTLSGPTASHGTTSGAYSLFLSPTIALAAAPTTPAVQTPSWYDCAASVATCGVFYVTYTVDTFMTLFVAFGAFLVRLGLQFNSNIFNSPAVQTGFSVSLAIANLGFVLGIIVIALATILRNQTYGIKQLLWKLVVMAILVNFGLVIMAPIVGFADSMTNYFVNATSPGAATGGYEGYVTTMAQAFSPQGASDLTNSGCKGATGGLGALCNTETGLTGNPAAPDAFTQQVLSMGFSVVFLALTAFTFMCLAVLLIIRYLMLGGLLIVLPLAWLTWVFPKFDNSYSKWWNNFIKWTFFPPLALFFIYLAFTAAANTGGTATQNTYLQKAAALPAGAQAGPEAALAYQTGGAGGPIQQAADEILLVGLTIMGLMFANSLSGKAGSTVVNGGVAASRAVGGYVGKQTKKGVRAGLRAAKVDKAVQKMREGQLGGLQKIPVAGWLAGRGASLAARAIEPHLNNKEIVDAAKKKVPDNIEEIKQNLKGNMNSEDRFAHLAKLIEKGELKEDQMVGNEKASDFLDKNQNMIKNYAFEKSAKDVDKLWMSTLNSRNAARAIARGDKEVRVEKEVKDEKGNDLYKVGDKVDPATLKKEAEREFYRTTPKADFAKARVNDMFSPKAQANDPKAFQDKLDNIINYRPEIAADLMKKMNGATLENFAEPYGKMINNLIKNIKDQRTALTDTIGKLGVPDQGQAAELERLKAQLESWGKRKTGFDRAYGSIFGSAAVEDKGGEGGGGDKGGGEHK